MTVDRLRTGFRDRVEAGDELATALGEFQGRTDITVLGVARGGLPVAARVAAALMAPLDVAVVRKLGFPGQPELAMGAIGPGGVRVMNAEVMSVYPVPSKVVEATAKREQVELERRERLYRDGRPAADLRGRTIVIVDDGLATGSTMLAAVASVRAQAPASIVVAVPVSSNSARRAVEAVADRVVCLISTDFFFAVGQWYEDFSQTTDEDIQWLLERNHGVRA